MRRILTPVVIAVLVMGVGVGSAAAPGDLILSIPVDTVVFAAPGSLTEVARADVDADDIGEQCEVLVEADNNASVHPGNDLVVASGGTEVVLSDVEGEPGRVTFGSGLLTLGPIVTVTLDMGGDGVFSGGFSVVCQVPEAPPTSSSSVPPSSSSMPPTSSSEAPPTSSSVPPTSSSEAPPSTSTVPPTSTTEPPSSTAAPSTSSTTTSGAPTTTVTPTVAPPQQTSVPPTSTPGVANPPAQPTPPSQEAPPATPTPSEPSFVG